MSSKAVGPAAFFAAIVLAAGSAKASPLLEEAVGRPPGGGGAPSPKAGGPRYTTLLSDVSTAFTTFQAGKYPSLGHHRGSMVVHVPIGGELLELNTRPNRLLFAPGAAFHVHSESGIERVDLDRDLFHVGEIRGEPDSVVLLSVHRTGAVEGAVYRADGETFVLEALERYPAVGDAPAAHDTAVYARDSLTTQALHGLFNTGGSSAASHTGCPVHGVQSEQHPEHRPGRPGHPSHQTPNGNSSNPAGPKVARSRRSKEEPVNCLEDTSDKKCSCDVALVGDYEYFMGPNCAQDANFGIQTMVNLVVGANKIYRETNFGGMTGLGFVVQSATIYSSQAAPGNPTPRASYSSGSNYLNAVTAGLEDNFTEVCSSMVFTHRDFHEGILGMAWVASSEGFGGICDPKYNCGFNTGINYGIEITPFVQSLVFAHEIGHNCGGEHDPEGDTVCSPGDEAGGNFIMFAAATDGSHGNNHRFSSCSKETMGGVMQYLRESCFVEAGLACGDGIVDGDEECDCGNACTPTGCCTSDCKVNTALGHVCSPQNPIRFPCCTQECSFKELGEACHDDDDCAEDAVCTGESASCPLTPKENHTECHCMDDNCTAHPGTNPQVCLDGLCDMYVCEMFGGVQCGLPEPYTCTLGCRGEGFGDGATCTSTFGSTPSGFGGGRLLYAGTPCRLNLGMCSPEGQCVLMDLEDAPKSPTSWAKSMVELYWQETAVGGTALILMIVVVVQYRWRRAAMKNRASSERAYLLAAANEEYEEMERERGFEDFDGAEMEHMTNSEEYAAPVPSY